MFWGNSINILLLPLIIPGLLKLSVCMQTGLLPGNCFPKLRGDKPQLWADAPCSFESPLVEMASDELCGGGSLTAFQLSVFKIPSVLRLSKQNTGKLLHIINSITYDFPQAFWKGHKQRIAYISRRQTFMDHIPSIVKVNTLSHLIKCLT